MKKTYIYLLFGLMVLAQIAASAQIVYKYERTIAADSVYKFKTVPVDPNDPFRGKYITLNFEINSFTTDEVIWDSYENGYAYFSKDENGFAVLETLSQEIIPSSDFEYVIVKIRNYRKGAVHFELPFDTYYMEESKAKDAEELYREINRNRNREIITSEDVMIPITQEKQDIYAIVHIKNGTHVLTDVVIDGVSMKDAVLK